MNARRVELPLNPLYAFQAGRVVSHMITLQLILLIVAAIAPSHLSWWAALIPLYVVAVTFVVATVATLCSVVGSND